MKGMYGAGINCLDLFVLQVSQAAREELQEESSGINISKLKQIMREEDKVDKKVHASKLKEKNWLVNKINFTLIPILD